MELKAELSPVLLGYVLLWRTEGFQNPAGVDLLIAGSPLLMKPMPWVSWLRRPLLGKITQWLYPWKVWNHSFWHLCSINRYKAWQGGFKNSFLLRQGKMNAEDKSLTQLESMENFPFVSVGSRLHPKYWSISVDLQ